jgi:transposase
VKEAFIVLDNASSNKSKLVTAFAKEKDLQLFFLPPYSSTLNPGWYRTGISGS